MLIDGKGCWLSRSSSFRDVGGAPALFVDRDNLLLADPGFLHRPEDVRLLDGASALVGWANRHGIPVILVTNQSGIARRIFTWADFMDVNRSMAELLTREDAWLDAILACAWHPTGVGTLQHDNHPWRKPRAGMFHAAHDQFGVGLARSWMVGDRLSDIRAARAGGLAGAILVNNDMSIDGAGERANGFRVMIAPALPETVPQLPRLFGNPPYRRSSSGYLRTVYAR